MRSEWVIKLHRWGFVLVSRIVGTQLHTDQRTKGIRNEINRGLMMRAELNALTQVLIDNKVITTEQFAKQVSEEAKLLCKAYEEEFKGAKVESWGINVYDPKLYAETTKDWPK